MAELGLESKSASLQNSPFYYNLRRLSFQLQFRHFVPLAGTWDRLWFGKIQGSLGRMTAHPSVHREWGSETRDWHEAYPWLFLGAKQTQKESHLKEHSVFPSLLTSPGPVPMIIGKQRVWFFWDQNQSYAECSDSKCCWLTVDGQCSRVSFSWAGC